MLALPSKSEIRSLPHRDVATLLRTLKKYFFRNPLAHSLPKLYTEVMFSLSVSTPRSVKALGSHEVASGILFWQRQMVPLVLLVKKKIVANMQKLFLYDFEIPMEAKSLTLVFVARANEPYNERNWLYMPPLMLTGDAHIKKKSDLRAKFEHKRMGNSL